MIRLFFQHAWIHVTLVLGVIIFLTPFVWMMLTSLRTDEELLEPGVLPSIPTFVGQSPHVRPPPALVKPADVDGDLWDALRPQFLSLAADAVKRLPDPITLGVDRDALAEAAAPAIVNGISSKLPRELWSGPREAILREFAARLSVSPVGEPPADDPVRAAVEDRLARLEIRGVQLRTIDAHVATVCAAGEVASKWVVESGDASLLQTAAAGGLLRYDFSKSRDPLTLRFDFEFPLIEDDRAVPTTAAAEAGDRAPRLMRRMRPDELHKLFVAIKPDDSWHRVSATLDIDGGGPMAGRWTSQRTTWLAQHRPVSIIFQPPSFDDDTYRNKVWVPLKKVGTEARRHEGTKGGTRNEAASEFTDPSSPSPSLRASVPSSLRASTATCSLRLTLHPSSTATAIYGKTIRNYERAFYQVPFFRYVLNSIILVALTTIGMLFSSTFVAYAFARLHWPGRSVALVLLLSTMMLPHQVTMIPQFLIWRELGWYNTLNPIWFPAWLGGAFFIFLMTQHMKTIPKELEEAARLDGLNAVQTWWYIIVPLVKPAAAAIAILTIMGSWNEFMGPLIFLRDQSKFPLSLGLFALRVDVRNDWTLIMAGNVMMTVPVLMMFFLFQRYFIQGMSMSGMKG